MDKQNITTSLITQKHHPYLTLLLDVIVSTLASTLSVVLIRATVGTFVGFKHHAFLWPLVSIIFMAIGAYLMGCHLVVSRYISIRSIGRYFAAVLIKEAALSILLAFGVLYFGNTYLGISLIVGDFTMTICFVVFARVVIAILSDTSINDVGRNVDRLPVMVYGVPEKAISVITRLANSSHYMVMGLLSTDAKDDGHIINSTRIYSFKDEADLHKLKNEIGFEGVIFASSNTNTPQAKEVVNQCMAASLHILMAPGIEKIEYGGRYANASVKQFKDNEEYIPDGMSGFSRGTKRIIDCILSGILLVIFSPLFLICWIAVRKEDGGPAIYSQERVGRFGRTFNIYKFRSMRMDAEAMGPALFSGDEDPRLTKVGKFLRLHHLDELPQLWNVFCGDMAFIGYRPERKFYIQQIAEADPRYYFLYQIRPGVTSYATLKNGYTDTLEKMLRRLEYDLYYLRHRSLWFDISILFQTFMSIVFGKKF